MKDKARRVGLGIAADDQDSLTKIDESRECILRGRRLADASLSVECNLSQSGHGIPFRLASLCFGADIAASAGPTEQLACQRIFDVRVACVFVIVSTSCVSAWRLLGGFCRVWESRQRSTRFGGLQLSLVRASALDASCDGPQQCLERS